MTRVGDYELQPGGPIPRDAQIPPGARWMVDLWEARGRQLLEVRSREDLELSASRRRE